MSDTVSEPLTEAGLSAARREIEAARLVANGTGNGIQIELRRAIVITAKRGSLVSGIAGTLMG